MSQSHKIAIIDYSKGEVFVYPINKNEGTDRFLNRKGFNPESIVWIRGNIKVNIEKETIQDENED